MADANEGGWAAMSHTHTMHAAPDRTGDVYVCACGYQADGKAVRETCPYPVTDTVELFKQAVEAFRSVSLYFRLEEQAVTGFDSHAAWLVLDRFGNAMFALGEAIEQHE